MNTLDSIRALFHHMEWADAEVAKVVLASEPARNDPPLRDRLRHLYMVQHAFLETWRGGAFDPRAAGDLDLPDLIAWARDYHADATAWLAALREEDLDRPMPVSWAARVAERIGRDVAVTTYGDTLLQVALHSTYHRGQVNQSLRVLGCEPTRVDFIAWIWFGKPAARWPEAVR